MKLNTVTRTTIPMAALMLLSLSSAAWAQAPAPGGFGPGGPGPGAGQGGFGPGGAGPGRQGAAAQPAPAPSVAPIPSIKPITGAGKVFDSAGALWPGMGLDKFDYTADEYRISGTAAGAPYEARLVIRRPKNSKKFSGLAVAEAMHPAAASAHAFELNSLYLMDAGHIAVEIDTQGSDQIAQSNPERYGFIKVANNQTNEILAQAGALIKSPQSPIANMGLRKLVLWGTSASSGILVNYLPTHGVLKLAGMANIYDGFMPTMNSGLTNGAPIRTVDVPMILVPTQREYQSVATSAQDSDEPGSQFRVYEFPGLAHLDSRNTTTRFTQEDCVHPLSKFPIDVYLSVALHHLFQWVDKGIKPPRAPRVIMDLFVDNDGSLMQLDEWGNAMGGIRNTYVDFPTAKYTMINEANPKSTGPGMGRLGTPLLCSLSGWQTLLPEATLRKKYGTPAQYVRQVEARLKELEKQGWSLPVYHDIIMNDARAVRF